MSKSPDSLQGKLVRLEFKVRDATLFDFEFHPAREQTVAFAQAAITMRTIIPSQTSRHLVRRRGLALLVTMLAVPVVCAASTARAASMIPVQQFQAFDIDPGWEGANNRAVPVPCTRTITQDFGYRSTSTNAGGAPGEMGGLINRSPTPSYYAKVIAPKSLEMPLSASGRFSVTQSSSSSGMLFGWFNSTHSGGWRGANSLAFRLSGESGQFRVLFEYATGTWHAAGSGVLMIGSPAVSLLPADGTSHIWNLSYDPGGNGGGGRITFVIDAQTFTHDLAAGDKAEGAVFDRFGMFNLQVDGSYLTAYFDDLVIDSMPEDFSADPVWSAVRNQGTFMDCEQSDWHNFGYSPTAHNGGATGEMGGLLWRTESSVPTAAAYYGAAVPAMDLNSELKSAGKVVMTRAAADSAVLLGWFNSATARQGESPPRNFMGILIEGPSRAGYFFRGAYNNSVGLKRVQSAGPPIMPNAVPMNWVCHYSPTGNASQGSLAVTLNGQTVVLNLDPGVKAAGAMFDRFGIVNVQAGGHFIEAYFDNVSYTALQLDTDDDGIPDSWELANGLDANNPADASADTDGDGLSNGQEFLAGTNPRNSASGLPNKTVERIGTDVRVTFPSVLGKLYAFEYSGTLAASSWLTLQTNVPGTGADVVVTDSDAAIQPRRFYRVRVLF